MRTKRLLKKLNNIINLFITLLIALAISSLFTGCSTIPNKDFSTKNISWQEQQKNNINLSNWHIVGKIGFTDGKDGGSASIDWIQEKDNFKITLYGPFKVGTSYITKRNGVINLSTSEGIKQTATSPEEVILQQFGWTIPIDGLIYWAKGIPKKNIPIKLIQLSKEKRLDKLSQQGWNIEYYNYKNFGKFILPTKINLQYKNIKIKLIFKNWDIRH
jgi:outer membrane lipoprotein LolB